MRLCQFLSINFFSWISSIFVGFFKSSRFLCHSVFRCSQKRKYIGLFALFVLNFFLKVSFIIPECNLKNAPSVKFHYFSSILFSVEGTNRSYSVDAGSTVRMSLVALFVRAIISVFRKRLNF